MRWLGGIVIATALVATPTLAKPKRVSKLKAEAPPCTSRLALPGTLEGLSIEQVPGYRRQEHAGHRPGRGSLLLEGPYWARVWFDTREGDFAKAATSTAKKLGVAKRSTWSFVDGKERVVVTVYPKSYQQAPYYFVDLGPKQHLYIGGRFRPGAKVSIANLSLRKLIKSASAKASCQGQARLPIGVAPHNVAAPPATAQRTKKGVFYRVLQSGPGVGPFPKATTKVEVHYSGWTSDGKMFDSSRKRGRAATFPLNRLIPGWTDAVQLMRPGDIFRIWIPERLAYEGRAGAPQGMLVFDIELIRIVP